ncbi:MAG: DPP IV N-terminal domain-containing protein [Gemmatimonadetes bacterium]|nr:DPP IV N-terminal domain-containing protein [Gemmatimonadota bacterium]
MRAFARLLLLSLPLALPAQDRLRTMPRYERYQQLSRVIPGSVRSGAVTSTWDADSRGFRYQHGGKQWHYDVATRRATEASAAAPNAGRRNGFPERGRQFDVAFAPDSTRKAFYRDRNVWISDTSGANAVAVTTDGNAEQRTKNGSASWVYGEELGQVTAMWWSPDGKRLAYYRFDESPVKDFYLQMDQTKVQSALDVEAYPKAGAPNPIVELFVYDVATRRSQRIDVRGGQPFTNDVVGHYVYAVGWSPDGREITFNRTNRRQNVMEFTACDPSSGSCRVVVREEWPASWVENHPEIRFLADGRRFLWVSERSGFANIYLYDFTTGRQLATVTRHEAEVSQIVKVDEASGMLWYVARTGDNHMKIQLHRVRLDGTGDVRLTDPAWNHTISLAPDARHFVDVAQTHDRAPITRLLDARGTAVATIAESNLATFDSLGLKRVELFTYKAADGVTDLHGMLSRPSDFDSTRRYPVLVTVYAGPATNGARETFAPPHPLTELGFIVLSLDSRSAGGRGKRFLDAIYLKLGTVEIDDQAAGVRALWSRPYIDRERVGIFGSSYGGYASALALLRHPDVFAAASASSSVTDWRHYDTIYTERYMWIPQENAAGYDAGSAMAYADKLKGRLMIYYGTADNNVHPNNTMQLIQALQRAGKSFEVQVGPDAGHTALRTDRMMEFFIEQLVLRPTNVVP